MRGKFLAAIAALAVSASFVFGSYSSIATSKYLSYPTRPVPREHQTVPIQVKSMRVYVSPSEARLYQLSGWLGAGSALLSVTIMVFGWARLGWFRRSGG
jgi:hypothetical protein